MKKFLYITGLILTSTVLAQPQPPFIHSLDKYAGTANEVVTIFGTGFSSPTVYFGKGKVSATFVSSSANVIEVLVPATATYGSVTVVNSNGLSAASSQLFSLSFDNDFAGGTYSPARLVTTATGGTFAYDLCLCDFDGDDLLDAIVTHDGSNNFGIELNTTSSPSSLSFNNGIDNTNLRDVEGGNSSHYAECADLNGDGKPDLVITTSSGGKAYIHIYQNTSSLGNITFNKITRIFVTNSDGGERSLKRIRLADIDGDGKLDIVVGEIQSGFNDIIIYLNNSSGAVLFNTTENLISVPGATHTASIFSGDLNNDGKIDLAILPYSSGAQIYLMKNTSLLPGSVSFELANTIGSTAIRWDIVIADFNNDGLNDIASTQNNGSDFSFVEISQNAGNFTFLDAQALSGLGGISLEGLNVGDMNGDGFADVIGASLTNDIVYIENTTSPDGSDITFTTPVTADTGDAARNIRVGDINNDGKPDIVFTNNSKSRQAGQMGYIINDNCMTPVIEPLSGKYCNGSEFILRATAGEGVTYTWTATPGGVSSETSNELNLSGYNTNVSVLVTATSPDGSCAMESLVSGSYTVGSVPLGAPTITDPGIVCLGDDLSLIMSTPASATNYYWTGPNGFSSTLTSPTIPNVSSVNSGTYTLIIDNGDCLSPEGIRIITISGPPVTTIEIVGCGDGSVDLQARDLGAQFDYQWKQGASKVGTNSASYTASAPGSYTLEITDANMCTYTSIPVIVYASTFTGVQFFSETEICSGLQGDFTAGETGTGVITQHLWEVDTPELGSVQTFTGSTLSYTFTVTGTKVSLFTTYTDGIGCSSKTITVSADPAFTITPSAMTKCSSDEVMLTLTGADTGNGDSWTWDDDDSTTDLTGEISNVLSTSVAATYTATYTSGTGCQTTTSSVTIANYPGIGVTATESTFEVSDMATTAVKRDTIIFAEEQTFVTLTADNSLEYTWTADSRPEDLDNSNTASVIVTPSAPVIMVTVSGQTPAEGGSCIESTEIVIMSGSLTARKSFSPNGDELNDCWSIQNSRSPNLGCTIYVFDSRGAVIFEGDTPFMDDCIWDGNYNGKPTPEGIYYFAMKCGDSSNNQTGSILLAR